MLVATLPAIEGRPVQWYLGIVAGDSILGASELRPPCARAGGYDGECRDSVRPRPELREARDGAVLGMLNEAAERGANAVVGVHFAYETIETPEQGLVLVVTASGTAVRI